MAEERIVGTRGKPMRKLPSIAIKVVLTGIALTLLLAATLFGLFWHLSRPFSDSRIIEEQFDSEFPGYSEIEVLERTGEGTTSSPRILVVEVVIESCPEPVTCQGEVRYFQGDPYYLQLSWYNWECIAHWMLVERARSALRLEEGPPPCQTQIEDIALVLKRWIENDWIGVNQIRQSEMRMQVNRLLEGDVPLTSKPITLFDISEAQVHDLVPELPEEKKMPTYVLRCDGTLILFLRERSRWWEQPIELQTYDVVLPTPVEKPVIRQ